MKAKSAEFSGQKRMRRIARFVFPLALVFLMGTAESYGMSTPYDPNKNGICNSQVKASRVHLKKALRRTFKALPHPRPATGDPGKKANQSASNTPIEITYQDLVTAYSMNNDLEYGYSDDRYNYEMNIGASDLVNPQHWEMPDCDLEDADYGEGIQPSETPYWDYFPSSTHCKLYDYEDEQYYEYYEFNEQSVTLIGAADLLTDAEETEVDSIDLLMTPLPLDIQTSFIAADSVCIDDTSYVLDVQITPYGFGTLSTPDGDLEVLAVLNDYNARMWTEGELIDEYNQPIIVFISKEGHQVNIWLNEDSDLEGDVYVDWIEYTRIVYNPNSIKTRDRSPSKFSLFQNYPNPFNSATLLKYQLEEADHVSLTVYDPLGKVVTILANEEKSAGTYEARFDGGNLPAGIYFYQLQTGSSKATRKLILMK